MANFFANTYLILILISFGGILGGTVNYFQTHSKDEGSFRKYVSCVVIGIAAAFLVPLFLRTISSNLITGSPQPLDYLVFLGICLVAAIFSKRFIYSIGAKVLREAKEAVEKAEHATEISESNATILKAINDNIVIPLQEKLNEKPKEENNNASK